jgi:hypothetical protein
VDNTTVSFNKWFLFDACRIWGKLKAMFPFAFFSGNYHFRGANEGTF